jgi:hypothetical protein
MMRHSAADEAQASDAFVSSFGYFEKLFMLLPHPPAIYVA